MKYSDDNFSNDFIFRIFNLLRSKSPEFNDLMRRLIDAEMNALNEKCGQMKKSMKPKSLPQLITLYLIQFYGLKRYFQFRFLIIPNLHPFHAFLKIQR